MNIGGLNLVQHAPVTGLTVTAGDQATTLLYLGIHFTGFDNDGTTTFAGWTIKGAGDATDGVINVVGGGTGGAGILAFDNSRFVDVQGTGQLRIATGVNTSIASGKTVTKKGAGDLVVNTTVTGASATALLDIIEGALKGTGTINAPLRISSGGTVAPGNSVGMLNVGANMEWDGKYLWELVNLKDDVTGTAGTDFDQIVLTAGTENLTGTSPVLELSFPLGNGPAGLDPFWANPHTWTVINNNGSGTASLTGASVTGYTGTGSFGITADPGAGGDVHLNWTVPEPGTVVLLALGGLAAVIRRRRRS